MILPLYPSGVDRKRYQNTFTGNISEVPSLAGRLSRSTAGHVADIIRAYKEISAKLVGQSVDVLDKVSIDEFNSIKGLTFFNVGRANAELNLSFQKTNENKQLFRMFLRDSESKRIQKIFFVMDGEKVVKNVYPSAPEKTPETLKFYSPNELVEHHVESELNEILDLSEPFLLKLRRSLIDVKPVQEQNEAKRVLSFTELNSDLNFKVSTGGNAKVFNLSHNGSINDSIVKLLDDAVVKSADIRNAFSKYSVSTAERIRRAYPDLVLRESKNGGYIFKNVGVDKEIVTVQKIDSAKHGELTRLLIENSEDKSVKFYLFSHNRLVKNTNPKYPNFIPERLKFYDVSEIKEFEPIFDKYFSLYNEKLADFENFVVNDLRPNKFVPKELRVKSDVPKVKKERVAKIKPQVEIIAKPDGMLDAETVNLLQDTVSLFKNATGELKKYNNVLAAQAKKMYPNLESREGASGLTFVNLQHPILDKISINILSRDVVKISLHKLGNVEPEVFLIDNTFKVISNMSKNSSTLPKNFKYADQEFIDNSNIKEYLPILHKLLVAYNEYIMTPSIWCPPKKLKPVLKKSDFVEVIQKMMFPEPKKVTSEYNDLLTKCFDDFNSKVKEIQDKLQNFFKQND